MPWIKAHFELALTAEALGVALAIGGYLWASVLGPSIFSSRGGSRMLGYLSVGVVKRGDSLPGSMPAPAGTSMLLGGAASSGAMPLMQDARTGSGM